MGNLSRKDMEARYVLFDHFALEDQRSYYLRTIEKHEKAASQVNTIRASIALLTGVSAAIAGLLVAIYFTSNGTCAVTPEAAGCSTISFIVDTMIILAVALPALAGFFNGLSDLYQWDRQISIYRNAVQNIEVADAHSPIQEMEDMIFRASMEAYSEGTLQVMSDESAQWGQSVRTPKGLQIYIEEARQKAAALGGDADVISNTPTGDDSSAPTTAANDTASSDTATTDDTSDGSPPDVG